MFMGKLEIENTIKLTKVKIRNDKKHFIRASLITIFLIAVNLIISIYSILEKTETVMPINMQNFANTMFFAGVLISLIMTISYRSSNNFYSVFPQNKVSRFMSTQIINYLYILFLAVAAMLAYFIQYSVFSIFALNHENVHLAYRFNIGYILNGFLVFIVYLSLLTAIINFVGVVFRKYRIYSFILFAIMVLGIAYNDTLKVYLEQIISIIVSENNLLLFYLKSSLIWSIIMLFSYIINKNTEYNRTERQFSKAVIVGMLIVGFVSFGIISQVSVSNYSADTRVTRSEIVLRHNLLDIEVDVSHLLSGSTIYVNNISEKSDNNNSLYVDYNEVDKASDGKLIVTTLLPTYIYNGIDFIDYTNPRISATLVDKILSIEYLYDRNVKVVVMSPWLLMNQFERYLDQGIFKESFGMHTQRGSGNIRIVAPDNINIKVINQ